MATIDWVIVVVCSLALGLFSIYTARFMKSVADFLAANRAGGRYMISISSGMASTGAISAVGLFEMYSSAGFPPLWWSLMTIPVGVVLILSGWVYYRFRETRCLTIAQFFEVRYSRKFRIYAGIITWLSGVVNFGIFPIVEARFFVYFLDWPQYFELFGLQMSTIAVVMLVTLGISTMFAMLGGQITVMLTDCAQGIFCSFVYLAVCFYLLHHFGWADIFSAMEGASKAGSSMINPFDTSSVKDFNAWFFLIGIFGAFYGAMSWQGSAAYQSSGINPHEQKMAQVISVWRGLPQSVMIVLIPLCGLALLNVARFEPEAQHVNSILSTIENPAIQQQMKTPVALSQMLPPGIKGLMCVVMLFFLITTQDTYLHSWGSMLIQDVVMPFRTRPFTPERHVRLLRLSILFVATFSFFFGLYFVQTEYILMYFAITGAIVSGAGAVIVGGLYWRRGTSAAAWAAMTVGWIIPIGSIILSQVQARWYANIPAEQQGPVLQFVYWVNSINGQVVWFWTMIACLFTYVGISLLTGLQPFNLDKMLHRGAYRVAEDHVVEEPRVPLWWKITGFTREFSRTDRWLAVALVVWNAGWFSIFLGGMIYHWTVGVPAAFWPKFWHAWLMINLAIGIPATTWFAIGGFNDIRQLFHRLRTVQRDTTDDGWVPRSAPEADAVTASSQTSTTEKHHGH